MSGRAQAATSAGARASSALITPGDSGGSISNSRRLAAKYASMSAWKSRWSRVRLVKTAVAKRVPSTRFSASACDDTSITHARLPRWIISRSSACTSGASGVVRAASRSSPPTL